jgi:hypothetical protein
MTGAPSTEGPWIAFLDLLGTKESAKIKRADYPDKIRTFSATLQEQAAHIRANTKVRFFSDSVYIQCDDAVELLRFASRLRWILFSSQIFFKAALSPGTLDDLSHNNKLQSDALHTIDVSGASFGPKAVAIYYEQETFKGVGYTIDPNHVDERIESHVCSSTFPADRDLKKWTAFFDVKYSTLEIGNNIEDDSLRANTKQKNLSRYYLSNIITAIQSSDFSDLTFHNDRWLNFPSIFYHSIINRSNRNIYKSIKGSEVVFFSIVNRIFNADSIEGGKKFESPRYDNVCNEVVRMLVSLKLVSRPLAHLPNSILSADVADDIGRRAVSLRMRNGEGS